MRVGVVGSGIAGLCVATELSRQGHRVEVVERREQLGGRAAVVDGVEHCSRIMMDDYTQLERVLDRVPSIEPGRSIWQTLVPVRRMVHLERRGWLALSRLYTLRAAELSLRDRCELARARRRKPLLATELRLGRLTELRMAAQLSLPGWARVVAAASRVGGARAFSGPTDVHLLDPWVEHLRRSGVELLTETTVERLRPTVGGAEIHHSGRWHRYDAVMVAVFVPDALELLRASGVRHRLRVSEIGMHSCSSATFVVDENEEVAARHEGRDDEVYLYAGGGFYALYQPRPRRVVAVSTRPGPDGAALVDATSRMLHLRRPVDVVGVRDDSAPASRLFGATPRNPRRIARIGAVHFAGSYLSPSYPLDSGEAAARSAGAVTEALLAASERP